MKVVMLMKNKNIKEVIKTAVTILVVAVAIIENTLIFRWFMDWYEKQLPKSLVEALTRTDYIPPRAMFIGIYLMTSLIIIPVSIVIVRLLFKKETAHDKSNIQEGLGNAKI